MPGSGPDWEQSSPIFVTSVKSDLVRGQDWVVVKRFNWVQGLGFRYHNRDLLPIIWFPYYGNLS